MLTISQLFIYPVKSLGGIAVQTASLANRGLEHDRRWMLIDEDYQFLTQRNHPVMALFALSKEDNGFKVTFLPDSTSQYLSYHPKLGAEIKVNVWNDECTAHLVEPIVDHWFSEKLQFACRLVYMPDDAKRLVDERFAKDEELVSFADAYPSLLIGEASLEKLNAQLPDKVAFDRFRPNIVFKGAEPHFEDRMATFTINDIHFSGVKPCARCKMIGIDQQTGNWHKEPMKTLARYRTRNNKVYFGQNLLHQGTGAINIGDEINVLGIRPDFMLLPAEVPLYSML